jgi:hypothetical protein
MRLYGWRVKRAGTGITASGVDADGAAAKISGIKAIEPRGRTVFAVDGKGEEHELVVGGQTN